MRVLQAFNRHRKGGGADTAAEATLAVLAEKGVEIVPFIYDSKDLPPGFRGRWKALWDGLYAREAVQRFEALVRARAPDVVHVHELYPLISPWILPASRRHGVPVVMSCYDYRLSCPIATHVSGGRICTRCVGGREHWAVLKNCRANIPESVAYALRNVVARRLGLFTDHVTRFASPTEFAGRFLIDHAGLPANRVTTLPCVIDIPDAAVDPAEGRYVAFAGRFVPEKGVEVLLEAIRLCRLPLRMAGDAPSHPAVRPGDPVEFVMTRSKAELADFYRGARILAVPSTWFETFGIVPAEAMSHAVPVVASRIGALQETVQDGVTGVLFEVGNPQDLAAKLRALWDDPDACRRLGAAGRERIARLCHKDAHYLRLMSIYEDAIRDQRNS
jgi:glycosyltransferase involved in cell wall biosynthesis